MASVGHPGRVHSAMRFQSLYVSTIRSDGVERVVAGECDTSAVRRPGWRPCFLFLEVFHKSNLSLVALKISDKKLGVASETALEAFQR